MPSITVMFEDQEIRRNAGEISFGRSNAATLKLDRSEADLSLSRIAGALTYADSEWVVANTSGRGQTDIQIDGGLAVVIRAGAAPLRLPTPCVAELRVRTVKDYVMSVVVQGDMPMLRLPEAEPGTTTVDVADFLQLTDRERRFLAALAEPRLQNPQAHAWTVPSTSDLRARLGLRDKQMERILNNVAVKMHPYLGDLIGSNSGRSNARRFHIVDFAIRTGSVTLADLQRLEHSDEE